MTDTRSRDDAPGAPIHIVDADDRLARLLRAFPGGDRLDLRTHADMVGMPERIAAGSGGCAVIATGETEPVLGCVRAIRAVDPTLPILVLGPRADTERVRAAGGTDAFSAPLLGDVPLGRPHVAGGRSHTHVTVRSMQPEDATMEQAFVRGLSPMSRHLRFFSGIKELPPHMLHAFTHPLLPRSCAVIATRVGDDGVETQLGVARYAPTDDAKVGEFAVVIADDWQGAGVGLHLMRALIFMATLAGLDRLEGAVLVENRRMLRFVQGLGFTGERDADDPTVVRMVRRLRAVAGGVPASQDVR